MLAASQNRFEFWKEEMIQTNGQDDEVELNMDKLGALILVLGR